MKKVLLFASMAAVLASCSDDDTTTPDVALAGTWKLTALTAATPVDINGDGAASANIIAETGCYGNTTLVFGANRTATLKAEEFTMDLTNDEMVCEMQAPQTGSYSQTGSNLTVTVGGEAFVFARSGNKLTATQADEDFGNTTMVLTKQ